MKKIYLLLGCSLLLQLTNKLSAQVLVSEDFSSATGITPPTDWTNNDIEGGGNVWRFNNPGGRTLTLPISDPAAIFDSDEYGSDDIPEDAALETPLFDASVITNPIFLSFDQYFDADYGGAIFVEVWNGSSWIEVYSSFSTSNNDPEHIQLDITADLNGASDAQVRFRWMGDYSMYWILDNVQIEAVTCIPISDLMIDATGTNSLDLSWTINGSETAWDIEYGAPGFMPGTGAELGTESATSNAFTLSGLDPGMSYDIYVRANCGAGDESFWTLVSGVTDCAPITSLPWTEDFESMTDLGYGYFQTCWSSTENIWFSDYDGSFEIGVPAYSGENYMAMYSWNGADTLWTPEFQLTAGRKYEFKFYFATEGDYDGWNAEVVSLNAQTGVVGTLPTGVFITPTEVPDDNFTSHITCFTPTVSGIYKFGVSADSDGNPYYLQLDDFSLIERGVSAGTNGTLNVCQIEGLVDLNEIIVKDDEMGSWTFAPNPSAIVNDSMFNPQFVPAGVMTVNYVTEGCLQDTASAIITIYPASSAGLDGNIAACKNNPIDLYSGLGGTVDFGGDWYDPMHNLLPGSQIMTGNFPGQFNYEYVTGNGVCPDDTAGIVVTVTMCDWLSVEETAFEEMNLYPNPSTGIVFIESAFTEGTFNLEITDVNGRIIESGNNTISAGTNSVDLSRVEKGTYFFKLSTENAEKIYRVVIQ
jgi:hypothetical protein